MAGEGAAQVLVERAHIVAVVAAALELPRELACASSHRRLRDGGRQGAQRLCGGGGEPEVGRVQQRQHPQREGIRVAIGELRRAALRDRGHGLVQWLELPRRPHQPVSSHGPS